MEIFTVGFAQKSAEDFFGLLRSAGVRRLMDIRLNNVSQLAGFTKYSVYPKLWEATGIAFPELCDRLVQIALEKHAERPAG